MRLQGTFSCQNIFKIFGMQIYSNLPFIKIIFSEISFNFSNIN